jgi:DNA-binding MarR family transcriptional regulator
MTEQRKTLIDEALTQVNDLMSLRRRAFCAHTLPREISLPQLHILMTLQDQGPMTISAIAHLFRISAPSASSIIDRMEDHGLVARSRESIDRRVVHVEISQRGRDLVEDLMGMKRAQMQHVLSTMTEDELRQVSCGLQALYAALSRAPDPADDELTEALA